MTEGSQCQNCGDLWTTKDGGMTCCEAPAPDYSGPRQFSLANGGEPLAAFYILDDRLKALVNGKEYDVGEVLDRLFPEASPGETCPNCGADNHQPQGPPASSVCLSCGHFWRY